MTIREEPRSALDQLADTVKAVGLDSLLAVLACTYTFDPRMWRDILDCIASCSPSGHDHLRGIPIDVVCDRHQYRGHDLGYNVHLWSGDNLFHPKLLVLLFEREIVWLSGSLNLTGPGWRSNRELVLVHEARDRNLPHGLGVILRRLSNSQSAKMILAESYTRGTGDRSTHLCSLDERIGERFLRGRRDASEVHVVAPFFDCRTEANAPLDSTVVKRLRSRFPFAQFHFYLPQIDSDPVTVQGSRTLFGGLFPSSHLPQPWIHAVPRRPGPLHGKLIVVRYGARGGRARLLAGSSNISEAALFRKGRRANVEFASKFDIAWRHVEPLLRGLGRPYRLKSLKFEPPAMSREKGWDVLDRVVYHPLSGKLLVTWRDSSKIRQTQLRYCGNPITLNKSNKIIDGFNLQGNELRLEARSLRRSSRRSLFPIEIPVEESITLADISGAIDTPQDWLEQLGALPIDGDSHESAGSPTTAGLTMTEGSDFEIASRIRDLADRMRFLKQVLSKRDLSPMHRQGHVKLLRKIFDTHDPSAVGLTTLDMTWRFWVRLELLVTLSQVRNRAHRQEDRKLLRSLTRRTRAHDLPDGPLKHDGLTLLRQLRGPFT